MYSPRLSIKFTVPKPAVHVQRHFLTVAGQNCAVGAVISTDIDQLGENTRGCFWMLHKKVQISKGDPPVIPVVHAICCKITSGSPEGWRTFGLMLYGTLTDGSCSIQVHLDWLACHAGRMVYLWTGHCFERSGTGSESMPCQAQNQSRSRLETKCCCSP